MNKIDDYINKTIEGLESDCESSAVIDWAQIILREMATIALQSKQEEIDQLKKRVDSAELKLFKLNEFIHGSGDLRDYSDEELLETQRALKVILEGDEVLKGEG